MSSSGAGSASDRGRELVRARLAARGWTVREGLIGRRPVLHAEREGVRRTLRVSSKTRGSWQTDTRYGAAQAPPEAAGRFWVFVDLDDADCFVVPEDWMVQDIHQHHDAYLAAHGGSRPRAKGSTHHKITKDRIAAWRDRWDLLDPATSAT
jgi:hypothetical protein